jgi:hypothetical protein
MKKKTILFMTKSSPLLKTLYVLILFLILSPGPKEELFTDAVI